MRTIALSVGLVCLATISAVADGKLYYGSRAGMVVSVLSIEGLDTAHAIIRTLHTREDAVQYCKEYVQEVTPKCVNAELEKRFNNLVHGNCKTGEFVDFYGERYRFEGRRGYVRDGYNGAKYALRNLTSGQVADGSSVSGYPTNIEIFRALCPATAPWDD